MDGRKQPIRGLWRRNSAFYARLTVEDDSGRKEVRRVRLNATTGPEAQKELYKLRDQRDENTLPVLERTPKLADYTATYFQFLAMAKDMKRQSTIEKERCAMKKWNAHIGHVRLDKIRPLHISSYIAQRQGKGRAARTVNLDVIMLRNVLKKAREDGLIKTLPMAGMKPLKVSTVKRELVPLSGIEKICEKGLTVSKNGEQLTDYLKLMAFCGSRRDETLRLRWSDVDFDRRQITIGADGFAKNHEHRVVDFNASLAAHLRDMRRRRAPDSAYLFPSPQRGTKDIPAKNLFESLKLARKAAKLPRFGFHDCRHFFISMCVMNGIDYMTIARWVGHKDGGVLIGKVYGHLSNEHARRQAEKLVFAPVVVAAA